MDSKKISFIIINEKTKKNINFSLSYLSLKIVGLLTIIVFLMGSYLLIQYYSQYSYREQLSELNIKEQKIGRSQCLRYACAGIHGVYPGPETRREPPAQFGLYNRGERRGVRSRAGLVTK